MLQGIETIFDDLEQMLHHLKKNKKEILRGEHRSICP